MSRWGQFQEIADLPERAFCENKYERTLEGGGGKGGGSSSQVNIPEWAQAATRENIALAKKISDVGYMPYYGPQVAAFNPTQLGAMQSNIGAAEAFGLVPQGQLTAAQGMPAPTTYAGGFQGYGSGDLYDQALAEFESRRPGQAGAYNALFVDPYGNAPATAATQQAQTVMDMFLSGYDYFPWESAAYPGKPQGIPTQNRRPIGEVEQIDGKWYLKTQKGAYNPYANS